MTPPPQVEDRLVILELQEMGLPAWHVPAPSAVPITQSFSPNSEVLSPNKPSLGLTLSSHGPQTSLVCALLAQLELSPPACGKAGRTELTSTSPKNPPAGAFPGAGATLLGLSPHPGPPGGLRWPQGLTRVADPANGVLADCTVQLSAGEAGPKCCSLLGNSAGEVNGWNSYKILSLGRFLRRQPLCGVKHKRGSISGRMQRGDGRAVVLERGTCKILGVGKSAQLFRPRGAYAPG